MAAMPLSDDHVRTVAQLARLHFRDDEREKLRHQLDPILDYVGQLAKADIAQVEPLAHPLDLHSVFRCDEPAPSPPTRDALANAPDHRDDFFIVPAVFEPHSS
jgi:aspartyl-tRNA(Asn)/glutamyl-tRNA(Gln) amidotransferase subunit C